MVRPFQVVAYSAPGSTDPGVAIAASRAGAIGILNLQHWSDLDRAIAAVERLARFGRGMRGVRLDPDAPLSRTLAERLPNEISVVVLGAGTSLGVEPLAHALRASGRRILLECLTRDDAAIGARLEIDGLVARGHESGGRISEETTYILLQALLADQARPVWAHGGIGLHTAAACAAAGAAGVVLDSQLLLAAESTAPRELRNALSRMEGDETTCLGSDLGDFFRVYRRPNLAVIDELQRLEQALLEEPSDERRRNRWREALDARVGWGAPESHLWPIGQDATFAAPLARKFKNVSGIVRAIESSVAEHLSAAHDARPLNRRAPLARAHGTEFPILQGPMTRVSDVAAFAGAVAEHGGLPFLALALLRGPQVRRVLEETSDRLGSRPWGVGILGFVPSELRQEQLEVVRQFRPKFALIAGGRPDQAATLERDGIATYLHVPAPGLLRVFLQDGTRRFIFEGRECGGHVGPRTSFVLWDTMVDVLLEALASGIPADELHVVFAGGIHDARSAAMVAALAGPLAARGVRLGVLMGTAYLFTEEAVQAGAIVEGFQQEALRCTRTVLLETGPGHSTRCADTPFSETFRRAKRALLQQGRPAEEVRQSLENLNLGRLRIASKGLTREDGEAAAPRYVKLDEAQQQQEGMYMIGQVASLRSDVCRIADLHESVSVGATRLLAGPELLTVPEVASATPRPVDVAIVGMGCLLPKAPSVGTFWRNILDKVDAVGEVPKDRFDADAYFDADRKARDKIYSKWGGFLDDVAFDPMRYGIPPAALPSIDPLQLLTLEVVRQALDDAGYADGEFARDRASVILGAGGGLGDLGLYYGFRATLPLFIDDIPPSVLARLPEWTEDSFPGLLLNVTAGRVANRFDLGGVNFTVDAACASSLAAVYLASRELDAGTSDVVIAGGVDTIQSPFSYLAFSKTNALSPRGRCRPFDSSADGIAISEGLVVVVLKRLADAERDGDRIYAVIKGIAGSSDGRDRSLTAPRPEGQIRALKRAYAQAGVSPSTVGLVEAHGTGTVVGDASEVASLVHVYQEANATPQSCALGSVKSMIGHTKCAAGVAGLVKVALSLYHRVLPPTLHVTTPNGRIVGDENPFFVNTEPLPWFARGEDRRRGAVSAFGFGGTNFHAVLEEYSDDFRDDVLRPGEWPAELFVYRATASALEAELGRASARLATDPLPPLAELATSAWARAAGTRNATHHLAIVATSHADLRDKIAAALDALRSGRDALVDPRGIYLGETAAPRTLVAWMFPGQGSQHPYMLRDLALHFPIVRQTLEEADRSVAGLLPRPLTTYIYPRPAFHEGADQEARQALTDTQVAQTALGAVEMGVARLLTSLGVRPDMTAGHSYGEYVALWAAGALSTDALLRVSEARGRIIKESVADHPGSMAAVSAEVDCVRPIIEQLPGVWVANLNAPRQTVIAGGREAIAYAVERLNGAGLRAKSISVACAFHSPLMASARDAFAQILSQTEFAAPSVAVYSNALAARFPADPASVRAVLTDHLVQPVRFSAQIAAMYDAGARIFVEVGPGSVLSGLVGQILEGTEAIVVPVDGSGRSSLVQLLHAVGRLAATGRELDVDQLFRGRVDERRDDVHSARPAESKGPSLGWLVNGGRARPASEPRTPVPSPVVVGVPAAAAVAPTGAALPASASVAAVAATPIPLPENPPLPQAADRSAEPAASVGFAPAPPEGDAQVMLQFQRLMSQFLETQNAVMRSYLGSVPEGPRGALPVRDLPASPVFVSPAPLPLAEPTANVAAAPAPVHIAPEAPPTRRDELPRSETPATVADMFLGVVAARTGYPIDMLNRELAIEGDLGIDSIKRVEILSAFQRQLPADRQRRLQERLEQITGVKTIGMMLDAVADAVGDQAPAAAAPPSPVLAGRSVGDELREILSARTGYPVEMLDWHAALEADLGIDSIKRVEILSAFQRTRPDAEQRPIQDAMERLASARTLRELTQILEGALAGGPSHAEERRTSPAPPPSAAGVRNTGAVDVARMLLEVVSARTGYPVELLDLDSSLEGDLGIDSIKRVEILSAFQRQCDADTQRQLQADMEELTGAPTLRALAVRLDGSLTPRSQSLPAPDMSVVPSTHRIRAQEDVPRITLASVEADTPIAVRRHPGRLVVVTDDETGLAEAVASDLRRAGESAVIVRHRQQVLRVHAGLYTADLTNLPQVEALIALVEQDEARPVGAIVHLLPLAAAAPFDALDLESWRPQVQRDLKSLYCLVRASSAGLTERGRADGALVMTVTAMGGTFASRPLSNVVPTHEGIVAFMKTLALELPDVRTRALDLDREGPVALLQHQIAAEIGSSDDTLLIGYTRGLRMTLVPRVAPLNGHVDTALRPAPDWVVLVTGGARGITAEIALALALEARPTLVIAGLSPLPPATEEAGTAALTAPHDVKHALADAMRRAGTTPSVAQIEARYTRVMRDREIRENLESLRRAGSRVEYHQVDVRDELAFAGLLDDVYRRYGRIDGVIHGAGIIEDKLIKDKSPDSFDRVLHTKTDSAFILARHLRPDSLKLLLFMSSITAAFGNVGQADYGAANGILNALAALLSTRWSARVVALNWGPWDKVGMVSDLVRDQFARRGIQVIPPAAGVEAVHREIARGSRTEPVVVFGDGPWLTRPVPTPALDWTA